jgi:4-amino-4-deoxy-L-arabinose transferase-like glycosyltransferase
VTVPSAPSAGPARTRLWWKGPWSLALAVFAVALAARLAVLSQVERHYPLADRVVIDEQAYESWALEIAAGDWLGSEVFFQEPLYPYWIAGVYSLAGPDRSLLRRVQAVLGALTAAGVYLLARRLFGPLAGLVAGAAVALHRAAWFLPAVLLKENLVLPLLCALAALLTLGFPRARPSAPWRALTVGVLAGLGALLRGNFLLLIPWLAAGLGWLAWRGAGRRAGLAQGAAVLAGVALVLLPVALRNYAVGEVFALTTSGAGTNVYGGNNLQNPYGRATEFDWVRGIPEHEAADWEHEAERRLGRELSPTEVSRYWLGQVLVSFREHPRAHLLSLWNKLRLSIGSYEVPDNHSLDWAAQYVPLLSRWMPGAALWGTLGLAGLLCFAAEGRRRPAAGGAAWPLVLLYLGYLATVVATVTSDRARLPLLPLLAPFAGLWVVRLRERPPLAGVTLALAAAAVLWPVLDAEQRAEDLDKRDFNLAVYALEDPAGLDRAEEIARRLAARHPGTARLESLLAEIEGRRGLALRQEDPARAQEWLQSALDRLRLVVEHPRTNARERFRANSLAGVLQLELGNLGAAERRLREALEFDPEDSELWLRLAEAVDRQGRRAEARALVEALAVRTGDPGLEPLLQELRREL